MTRNRNSRRAWWEVGMYSSSLEEDIESKQEKENS